MFRLHMAVHMQASLTSILAIYYDKGRLYWSDSVDFVECGAGVILDKNLIIAFVNKIEVEKQQVFSACSAGIYCVQQTCANVVQDSSPGIVGAQLQPRSA